MIINSFVPLSSVFVDLPESYRNSKVAKVVLERFGAALLLASGGVYVFSHAVPVIPCTLALIALAAARCLNPSIKIREPFQVDEYTHLKGEPESTELIAGVQVSQRMVRDICRKFAKLFLNGKEIKIEGEGEAMAEKVVHMFNAATGSAEKTAQLTHFLNQNLNHVVKDKHFSLFADTPSKKLRFKQNMHPPFTADRLEEVRIVLNSREETIFARSRFGVINGESLVPNIEIHADVVYDFLKLEATYTIK